MDAVIKITDVHYKNPKTDKKILQGINLSIAENEIITVTGVSGCGKTLLLKITAGLYTPLLGDVIIENTSIFNAPNKQVSEVKDKIGFLFQNEALISNLTAFENAALPLRYHTNMPEDEISNRVYSLFDKMGIYHQSNDFPAELSISHKKMVALARALIRSPKYLFLDEPLVNLDYQHRLMVLKEVKQLKDLGTTIFIAAHYIKYFSEISDRFAVISKGKIEMCGTYKEIESGGSAVMKEILRDIGGSDAG